MVLSTLGSGASWALGLLALSEYLDCVGMVACRLELLEELSQVHDTFHVSKLRKCIADETVVDPLEDIQFDDRLNYIERPVTILDRRVNTMKNKVLNLVKV